ncbi:MAG: class I SAM-dependent methyltransferase, partial [Chthoniobacterales bacterium]
MLSEGQYIKPVKAELLLHSLSEFSDIILKTMELIAPKHVVEIGVENGAFTLRLLEWLQPRGAHLTSIDPSPCFEWPEDREYLRHAHTMSTGRSPEILKSVPHADIYLLDGDHNYWCVLQELREIEARSDGAYPVVIFHDVGWPCARRDLYYAPGLLPQESVHPHSFDMGVVQECGGLVKGGFRSEGKFALARHEGGARNGVLTAVEDFMKETPGYELFLIPVIFGLGFLVPS